jgi:hypothetical protein
MAIALPDLSVVAPNTCAMAPQRFDAIRSLWIGILAKVSIAPTHPS